MKAKQLTLGIGNREISNYLDGVKIANYHTLFSDSTYNFVDWHWHDDFQLCIVVNGKIKFKVENEEFIIAKDEAIFINSERVHIAINHLKTESEYLCLDFNELLITQDVYSSLYETHVKLLKRSSNYNAMVFDDNDSFIKDIKSLFRVCESKCFGYELELTSRILRIWNNLILKLHDNLSIDTEFKTTKLKIILSYIHNNYYSKITLQDIAKEINLSNSECSRYFRKVTGDSLFQYIISYRIEKSANLLITTDLSISEISYKVGFESQSYYNVCFKKYKKITPKEYQRLNRF